MRDLKRANALAPAYKHLRELGFQVYTPMKVKILEVKGRRVRKEQPFMQDLLFVFSSKSELDKIVDRTPTLQYRFIKGRPTAEPMTVATKQMDQFIAATESNENPRYFNIEEITPAMYGSRIRIICDGPLNCCEGHLLRIKGSGKKRLLLELEGLLCAAVEISPNDYIEII